MEISFRDDIAASDIVQRAEIRTYRPARLIAQKINAFENRTVARDLYDLNFLVRTCLADFEVASVERLRALTSDIDSVEARFRPAFEEDDLFRSRANLVPDLLIQIQDGLRSSP